VNDVRWEGVRSRTLVDLVQPHRDTRWVTFHSMEEPYVDQISLDQFLLADVMLARHMDGKPLTRAHGAPLRLVIPEMYGYKGVKWVKRLHEFSADFIMVFAGLHAAAALAESWRHRENLIWSMVTGRKRRID